MDNNKLDFDRVMAELRAKNGGRQPAPARERQQRKRREDARIISVDLFRAYLPSHHYIFIPTRELWPASSVNAACGPQEHPNGEIDKDGNPKFIPASLWLAMCRPVDQMIWAPGVPLIVPDQLMADGGWVAASHARTIQWIREKRHPANQ